MSESVLASVAVAALTTVANIWMFLLNLRTMKGNEQRKILTEFNTYRFKELGEFLKELDCTKIAVSPMQMVSAIRAKDHEEQVRFVTAVHDAYNKISTSVNRNAHLMPEHALQQLTTQSKLVSESMGGFLIMGMSVDLTNLSPEDLSDTTAETLSSAFRAMLDYILTAPKIVRAELRAIHATITQ